MKATTSMEILTRSFLACLALSLVACDGQSAPPAPSVNPPTPPSVILLYTVMGTVSNASTGAPIANATVRVADGPNAGLTTTTDTSGAYRLIGLTFAGFSVSVNAAGFASQSRGVLLTAGTLTTTANFSLTPQNFSGTWNGTTSQGVPLNFTVSGTTISALSVDIVLSLAGAPPGTPTQSAVTCRSNFRGSTAAIVDSSFEITITSTDQKSPTGAFYSTTFRGSMASENSATGTIASFTVSEIQPNRCSAKVVDCSWPSATCTQSGKLWSATRP